MIWHHQFVQTVADQISSSESIAILDSPLEKSASTNNVTSFLFMTRYITSLIPKRAVVVERPLWKLEILSWSRKAPSSITSESMLYLYHHIIIVRGSARYSATSLTNLVGIWSGPVEESDHRVLRVLSTSSRVTKDRLRKRARSVESSGRLWQSNHPARRRMLQLHREFPMRSTRNARLVRQDQSVKAWD